MSERVLRHLILDRDGVLNREAENGGYVRDPSEFRWLPGALEALAILHRAGLRLTVASNQSGVGRRLMSLEQLAAVHERMQVEAARHGGGLDLVLFCPHDPEAGCDCRKPAAGLIREAIARSGVAAAESLVVGDDVRDIEAARRAGVPAALVRTGKGRKTEQVLRDPDLAVYDDLRELARAVTRSKAEHGD